MESQNTRKFKCQPPSSEDLSHQHIVKVVNPTSFQSLPTSVDLTSKMPPVYDQGSLGSCSANASCAAYKYAYPLVDPSRLYLYYKDRLRRGSVYCDSGASITDNMQVLLNNGICEESLWPYIINNFTVTPSSECDTNAQTHKILKPVNISQDLVTIKTYLSNGYPVVFGIACYQSIFNVTAENPIYNPNVQTESLVGGHALLCIGYDDITGLFKIRNSWSSNWAQNGNFYISYSYLLDPTKSYDFWCITDH